MSSTKYSISTTKRCLLLLNVGTPDSPKKKDVRKYLCAFLNDSRVIDLPWLLRKFLVNVIIIPFRLNNSTKLYEDLWKKHGRILDTITKQLVQKLNSELKTEQIVVKYAMRYGTPNMEKVLEEIKKEQYDELIVLPMFPQYAMSTVETLNVAVERLTKKIKMTTPVRTIAPFFARPEYIEAITNRVGDIDFENYDCVIFSYHGLPNRHLRKAHKQFEYKAPKENICCGEEAVQSCLEGCYKSECYETTRLVARSLGLRNEKYMTVFQSRLSRNWMRPFCDEVLKEKAKEGVKRIVVFTLSFTIDCLETINEIGEDYKEMFLAEGGETLDLIPALNDSDEMIKMIKFLIEPNNAN